jgi:hypothetical protein
MYASMHILLVTTKLTIIAWPELIQVTKYRDRGTKFSSIDPRYRFRGSFHSSTSPEDFTPKLFPENEIIWKHQFPSVTTSAGGSLQF